MMHLSLLSNWHIESAWQTLSLIKVQVLRQIPVALPGLSHMQRVSVSQVARALYKSSHRFVQAPPVVFHKQVSSDAHHVSVGNVVHLRKQPPLSWRHSQ